MRDSGGFGETRKGRVRGPLGEGASGAKSRARNGAQGAGAGQWEQGREEPGAGGCGRLGEGFPRAGVWGEETARRPGPDGGEEKGSAAGGGAGATRLGRGGAGAGPRAGRWGYRGSAPESG